MPRPSDNEITILNENDVVRIRDAVEADLIEEGGTLIVPSGTIGSIVLVHRGALIQPLAYEVEFYIRDQNCYVLATIDAGNMF